MSKKSQLKIPKLHDGRLWTVAEVAAYWRVKPRTVYRWIQSGKLKAIPVGRQFRIPNERVQAGAPLN